MKKVKATEETVDLKPIKTHDLTLTKSQILHLRDLFSIVFADGTTVSQSLALTEGRASAELELWKKITKLCTLSKIPIGDEAPNHVIGISEPPIMGVFNISGNDVSES
jgi:hypothetical protein